MRALAKSKGEGRKKHNPGSQDYNIYDNIKRRKLRQENKMDEHEQYIIGEQSQGEIEKYEQIASMWSQLYQPEKQQQIFQVGTLSYNINILNVNQNNQGCQPNVETRHELCEGKLVSVLKLKIFIVFTDYVQNIRNLLVNVEFMEMGAKRPRRSQTSFGELFMDLIESNLLFTQEEIRNFTLFLQNHQRIRQIISDLVDRVEPIFKDQILYCLYRICLKIDQLLTLDHLLQNNSTRLIQKIEEYANAMMKEMVGSGKIKELIFQEYQEQYKCQEENQKYFQQMLAKWINILIDSERNNEAKYKEELEDVEREGNLKELLSCDSDIDADEDDEDDDWSRNHGRKVRPIHF